MSPMPVRLFLLLLLACGASSAAAGPSLVQEGERLYREGVDLTGRPLVGFALGGVVLPPAQAACASCHRRSGMGGIEGEILVPPLGEPYLYQPGLANVQPFGRSFTRRWKRPAYSDETLARALREGIDPAGQPLAPPMPRYRLSDRQAKALIAYLKSLSRGPAPGVERATIHLATVVTAGVSAASRRALTEVLEAYAREKVVTDPGERLQQGSARGAHRDRGQRTWRLHLWEVGGPSATWRRQLEAHYRAQPVFAVVGGIAEGPWDPIDDFCNRNGVPCLLPTTDLPPQAAGFYGLYYSRGLALEAEALARHFTDHPPEGPLLQRVAPGERSRAAANAFRAALVRLGGPPLHEAPLPADGAPSGFRDPAAVVVWAAGVSPEELVRTGESGELVFSSTLLGGIPELPPAIAGRVRVIHPFVLTEEKPRHLASLYAWLRARGIALREERVQAEAYFAATTMDDALRFIGSNFSRDYLLEQIEEMLDSSATRSLYPRVTLGPGQRYASKGAWLLTPPVRGADPASRREQGDAIWIVP